MPRERKDYSGTDDSKRAAILNAAMAEFINGYEKASTDAIVKAAGVSKGLLFHYFGSKKELFLYAYEYAMQAVVKEFYDLINFNNRDVLARMKQILLLKLDLMHKHPMIFDFIVRASIPDHAEITENIRAFQNKLENDLSPRVFYDIDRSLFREDINIDAAIQVIIYTMRSYAISEANPNKSTVDYYADYDRYLQDLERYIGLFRTSFYKQED